MPGPRRPSGLAAIAVLAGLCLAAVAGPALAAGGRLALLGWAGAVDPALLAAFRRETGISVSFDAEPDADAVARRVKAGGEGFDLAFVADRSLPDLIAAGALAPFSESPAASVPAVAAALAAADPGGRHAVAYMWGALGFGYDEAAIAGRLGPAAGEPGWGWLLRPEQAGKLRDCGIGVLDDAALVLGAVGRATGAPAAMQARDWQHAADRLAGARPRIRRFVASGDVGPLASGELCLLLARSREVAVAARLAAATGGPHIVFRVPAEGAPVWFDAVVQPRDAADKTSIGRFLAFIRRPDIAMRNAAWLHQASAVPLVPGEAGAAAAPFYPPPDAVLFAPPLPDARLRPAITRLWQRVQAAR